MSREPLSPTPRIMPRHLQQLEAESIFIIREVVAECARPVMLYSIGKDSSVMVHLARKAFWPAPVPFPLLHVDTGWKFREMIDFRDRFCRENDLELLVHVNSSGDAAVVNPFDPDSSRYTHEMKTVALKQALGEHGFDAAFGGARRDEERARAKERVFSFRGRDHAWTPSNQRPELWNLFNARVESGESLRVFPLSNWTELDVWQYIHFAEIPVVPLYFAKSRPVIERRGRLIMVDDARLPLESQELVSHEVVRFRSLGCYPLTGAVRSSATSVPEILEEMFDARTSERHGRLIDFETGASMETKKREGYF